MDTPVVVGGRPLTATDGRVRVLLVETDGTVGETLGADDSYELQRVETVAGAVAAVETGAVDCVVSEHALPDGDGIELLQRLRERRPDVPFVLCPGAGDEGLASDAIGAGVTDYLPKSRADELPARLAAALADHTERQAILGRMTDSFFAVDTDWRFTYVNERGSDVLSDVIGEPCTPSELVGRSLWDEVPSAVDTQFYDEYHRAMDEQRPVAFEEYYDPTGTWFEVHAYPSPTGLSVYFRDVTERKEREEELVERERSLRRVYEVIADKDRSFEAKVDELLAIGREVVGVESAALSRVEGDEYVLEVVHDEGVESGDVVPLSATNCERAILEAETLVLADVETEAPELTERAGFTEQGIACYLGTPVWVDGEISGTFCFYDREPRSEPFDEWAVTLVELLGNWVSYEQERERREAELTRERNRMEEFASIVSHDVRNPLTVALGRLDLVREGYEGDPDHVDALETALVRIEGLVEDVLALSRSRNQTVTPEPHSLGRVAADAWEATGTREATLSVPDETATVHGDPVSLPQLLENLLRNSVEHAGTDVDVEVGLLSDADGLYVADDGPGIPDTERETVFDSGYTTRDDGTGFGLHIVSEIADAHGWSVQVAESETGGARFEVSGMQVG